MAWNLNEAIFYYKNQGAPGDQGMVISLFREIQQENSGTIPGYMVTEVAQAYHVKESFLLAIIRRVPSLRLSNTHSLELCAGPNCGKHLALAALAEGICRAAPGKVTVKYTPCMRMCGKGPNLKWDGKLYHQADEALLRRLIE